MSARQYFAEILIDANDAGIPTVEGDNDVMDSIIAGVYTVFAAIALFYIVRGALKFLTSGSDPNAVKSARNTIIYATIGLVGSTVVFGIIGFVIDNIGG